MSTNARDLQDILLGVIEIQPLDGLLRRLADAALHLTGADYAAIGAYGDDRSLTHFVTSGASQAERDAIPHPPKGLGLLGEFAIEATTINIGDVTRHSASVGFPEGHPPMGPFLGVPLKFGARALGAFYVTRRPGAPNFSASDQAELEGLAVYAAIAVSNAHVLHAEQRQRVVAQTLAQAARGLQEASSRRQAAERLVASLKGALHDVTEIAAAWVLPEEEDPQFVSSASEPALGPVLVEMLEGRPRMGRHEAADLLPASIVTVQTSLLEDGGYLQLAARSGRKLPAEQQLLLRAASELGGVGFAALERRKAAQALEEYQMRDAIARDLHDDIIQSIYAVGLGMHLAMNRDDVTKQAALEKASADLNVVIAELRSYIGQLTGEQASHTGMLEARLRALFEGQTTATWTHEIDLGSEPLGGTVERHVYMLARELISNVERHSQAQHARLQLLRDGDRIRLTVEDDGVGFEPNSVPDSRVGIRSIGQRVGDLGGAVLFDSTPKRGTTVTIDIPTGAVGSATT